MRHAFALLVLALVAVAASALGCGANTLPAPGQVMVVLGTDMTPGRDFDELKVIVRDARVSGDLSFDWRFRAAESGKYEGDLKLPATVAVVGIPGSTGFVTTIRVEASLREEVRVVREARVVIPQSGVQMLRMGVDWLCWDLLPEGTSGAAGATACAGEATCTGGDCTVSAADSTASLPAWDANAVFGDADSGIRGDACFQVLGCFAIAHTIEPALGGDSACRFPYSGSAESLNVGVALPPDAGRGFCAKNACIVPLDRDTVGGWSLADGVITVPRRLCTDHRTLAVSHDCPTKTEAQPPCAEWSSVGFSPAGNIPAFTLQLTPADGGL